MYRQEEFLAKAKEAFEEYQASTAVIREMIDLEAPIEAEWRAAVGRQRIALDAWAALPRLYGDVISEQ
ncbi:hypothetical protein [Pseudomonas sp. HY13-MNA-CIBAN-0226]|uniref:hypothetical protein n=1 Tax=Pseudomonas sp. HY13-MNA-CIBAN-0226 TaxID=3140473 RepID=UPI00332A80E8